MRPANFMSLRFVNFIAIALFLFACQQVIASSGLVINEIVSSNVTSLADADGDYPDWIELYNTSSQTIDLAAYTMSDDPRKPAKWSFPDIVLPSNSYILIFASGKKSRAGELHTNFKISASGESVMLFSGNGAILDSVFVPALSVDQSYGRLPQNGQWALLAHPTPGRVNSAIPAEQVIAAPHFSLSAGFYRGSVELELSGPDDAQIFYTLDGSDPDSNALVYSLKISLDTTTVVRAVSIMPDGQKSLPATRTYLIDENNSLPVFSLSTDPDNLWDPVSGIYAKGENASENYPYKGANFWREWERPVHIEFFENDGSATFSADAGVRIFGHSSVGAPFKPLVFYARKKYGAGSFKYQFFPDKDIQEFESIMLRNSGNDWNRTLFRDALMQQIGLEIGLPGQAYRPVVLFINGQYWGIHNLRERMNEHYIEENFHVPSDEIDFLAWNYGRHVYAGNALRFDELVDFANTHDLSIDDNYFYVRDQILIDNFIDYFVLQIYCNNRDWPSNNQYFWRPRLDNGAWMWLLKDMDHGFGYQVSYNYNSLVRNGLKDELFSALVKNDRFRNRFLNRCAYLLSTQFRPEHIHELIEQFKTRLATEMPDHLRRWAGVETFGDPPATMAEWSAYCNQLHEFAELRPDAFKKQVQDYFKLGDMVDVRIRTDMPDMGVLELFDQEMPENPWQGQFFRGVPISLKAKARAGYRFAGWQGVDSASDSVVIVPQTKLDIAAAFDVINSAGISIVINEINYNSNDSFDAGDWIELANPNNVAIDMSAWSLTDDQPDHVFRFPHGTKLPAYSYAVLCREPQKFAQCFGSTDIAGVFEFGLSSQGDAVRLFDERGELVDQVRYLAKAPWVAEANGRGATLALSHPFADNENPESWFASFPHGSPGRANIRRIDIDDVTISLLSEAGAVHLSWQVKPIAVGNIFRVQRADGDDWQTIADFHTIQMTNESTYHFVDDNPKAGVQYRLEYIDAKGETRYSHTVAALNDEKPLTIFENYPNPFNSETIIRFTLSSQQQVDVRVYNIRGQEVAHPLSRVLPAGSHQVSWYAADAPSGLYFCRIETPASCSVIKLTMQK